MVYYNENDEQKAEWLRELIRQGAVANGEVDTRSIKEVEASDFAGFAQCHFFAGIGVWSYALRLAGWPDDRPVSNDSEKRGVPVVGAGLAGSVHLATWATPAGRDYRSESATEEFNNQRFSHPRGKPLSAEATLTVSGETRIGYSARDGIVTIGSGAQLNPAHSRWLQGLPRAFCDCAVTAIASLRLLRKNSLRQRGK